MWEDFRSSKTGPCLQKWFIYHEPKASKWGLDETVPDNIVLNTCWRFTFKKKTYLVSPQLAYTKLDSTPVSTWWVKLPVDCIKLWSYHILHADWRKVSCKKKLISEGIVTVYFVMSWDPLNIPLKNVKYSGNNVIIYSRYIGVGMNVCMYSICHTCPKCIFKEVFPAKLLSRKLPLRWLSKILL